MNNTNNELLLKIYEEVKNTKELVGKLEIEQKENKVEIQKISELVGKLEIEQKENKVEIRRISDLVGKLEIAQKENKVELRKISGSVARIEVEHGEKLVALFDAFKVNTEKIEEQNERITKCENKIEKHDDQIYFLNSKVQNA